jgi:hypothetical protein
MANPEHVELVRQGAEAIAKWREENPDTKLAPRRAALREAALRGAALAKVRGAEQAYRLETVRFSPAEGSQGSDAGNDARYFETCDRPWPER